MGKDRKPTNDGFNKTTAHDRSSRVDDIRAYHGEPPDQRIPSRHGYQGPGQEGFYLNGSFVQSQTSIEMNPMGHHPDSRTTFQSQPMMQPYAMVPGNVPYNVHHPPYLPTAHAQYAHPANVIIIPVNQDMVRDTSTPIPSTEADNGKEYMPSIACIIFKRILSALCILFDISFNWVQFASMIGHFELPKYLDMFKKLKGIRKHKLVTYGVTKDNLTNFNIVTYSLGTVYGLLRIVNIIGETIIEYKKHLKRQNPNKPVEGCKGFQFIHGWIETLLGLLFEDMPQIIFMLFFSVYLGIDFEGLIKYLVWARIKAIKNGFRISSCKQKYKQCCSDCCKDCCVYKWDFTCCCQTLIFRPCACCGNEPCCDSQPFDICPLKQTGCFGEIYIDPDWAFRWFTKLQSVYESILSALIVYTVVTNLF